MTTTEPPRTVAVFTGADVEAALIKASYGSTIIEQTRGPSMARLVATETLQMLADEGRVLPVSLEEVLANFVDFVRMQDAAIVRLTPAEVVENYLREVGWPTLKPGGRRG